MRKQEPWVPELSIVIPTLNEEKNIGVLLKAIQRQTYQNFEIIVVDSESEDRTLQIVQGFQRHRKLRDRLGLLTEKEKGISLARNIGAAKARGEYLLFLDADVILSRNFLKNSIMEMKKRNVDAATCYITPLSNRRFDRFILRLANLLLRSAQFISPVAPGFCIFCKKELWKKVSGFDRSIKLAEDVHFIEKASKHGKFRVLKSSKIKVSVRRMDKEGRAVFIQKYVLSGIYRKFVGDIRSDIFKYEFGKYK